MRKRVKFLASGLAGALLLAVVGVLVGLGGGGAKADTIIALGKSVTYLTQAVPDTAGGRGDVFLLADSQLMVTDLAGGPISTLDAADNFGALALSADGATLYGSVTSGTHAGSVAAIAVSSVASGPLKATFYPLAAGDSPDSVAVQSGKVWVSFSATVGAVTSTQIGAIDLASGTFEPAEAPGSWAHPVLLAADPENSGVLVAADYQSSADAETFTTTTSPATPRAARAELGSAGTPCNWLAQLAVMPGGQRFAAACTGTGTYAYTTGDLATDVAFYNAHGAGISLNTGVAVDADGSVAVANRTEAYVYQPDGTLLNTLTLGGTYELLEGKGLAWADTSGGPSLAAAYGTADAAPYYVRVFGQAQAQRPATLTLTATAPKAFGQPVTLSGLSLLAGGAGDPSPVTITRTGPGGTQTLTAAPSASGAFTLANTPKAAGSYVYTASVGPVSSAAVSVRVPPHVPTLTLAPGRSTVGYKTALHLTATLGATYVSRSLTISAEVNGSGTSKVIASGTVNARGRLAVTVTALQSTTFTVSYRGDADDTAARASTVIAVRALVRQTLGGHYGSKKVGGVAYLLYHHTATITIAAAVTPGHPGGCVEAQTQKLAGGAWRASGVTGCAKLSLASKASVRLAAGKRQRGAQYRVRVAYLGGSPSNAGGVSGWAYFIVER